MARIWSDEGKLATWLEVELAALDAFAEVGRIPAEVAETIRAQVQVPTPERVAEIERVTDHDTAAFVDAVAEQLGPEGRFVHYGLTSSDVIDTGLALQIRKAGTLIAEALDRALETVVRRAEEHRTTLCIGRSHGIHAEPVTFGWKLAGWAFELDRARRRVADALEQIRVARDQHLETGARPVAEQWARDAGWAVTPVPALNRLVPGHPADLNRMLRSGALDVIVQVQMLGEGFDHPPLSVAAIFRPFRSLSPYIQFVGRVMRVNVENAPGHPDNEGIVVSHVGLNIDRHWDDFKEIDRGDQEMIDGWLDAGEIEPGDNEAGERRRLGSDLQVTQEIIDSFLSDTFLDPSDDAFIEHAIAALRDQGVDLELLGLTREELQRIAALDGDQRIGREALVGIEAAALLLRSNTPYYGDRLREVAARLDEGQRLFSDLVWLRSVRSILASGECGRPGENAAELLILALKGAGRPVLLYRNVAPPVQHSEPAVHETRR